MPNAICNVLPSAEQVERSVRSGPRSAGVRGGREDLARDRLGGVRAGEGPGGGGHRAEPRGVAEQGVDLGAQALRRELRVGQDRGGAASAIQRALAVWWSAEACGYGISRAGSPYWASSNTEPPARATARSEAASARAEDLDVLVQVVVRAGSAQRAEVARAGDVET